VRSPRGALGARCAPALIGRPIGAAGERCTVPLDRAAVRTIDRRGGTFLHTSRTNPQRVRGKDMPAFLAAEATGEEPFAVTTHVLRVLEHLQLDALIPIGGDDTLSFARRLHERLAGLMMDDKRRNPSNYAMCTVSEGATILDGEVHLSGDEDPYGHRKLGGIGETTGQLLKEITGHDIITQELGYLMRSGRPDSLDLMVATNFAVMAADHAVAGEHGRMMALRGGTYTNVPIMATGAGVKRVDVDALYDSDAYRPKVRQVEGKPMFLY